MLDTDDLPILPIGIAIGIVVILVVLISLALVCGVVGFAINPLPAGLLGLSYSNLTGL
ncbi:MAG: hypothetical protein HC875_02950 [Anaerolineales bacterium]|nr:hypothetical protein [Anaerolineales bacterium]